MRILCVESLSSSTTRISTQYAQISPGDYHPCTVRGLPIYKSTTRRITRYVLSKLKPLLGTIFHVLCVGSLPPTSTSKIFLNTLSVNLNLSWKSSFHYPCPPTIRISMPQAQPVLHHSPCVSKCVAMRRVLWPKRWPISDNASNFPNNANAGARGAKIIQAPL